MASITKPTIVLVTGAWHIPELYSPLTNRLADAGFKIVSNAAPSVQATQELESFDPDVEVVRKEIQEAADRGEDVAVLVHSYGGATGGEATKGLLKKDRLQQGLKGGVTCMIYMCAFAPDVDQHVMDWAEKAIDTSPGEHGTVVVNNPAEVFYQDVDPAIIADTIPKLRPQAAAPFVSKLTTAPWKEVPSTYILCEKDEAIPVGAQEKMTDPTRGGLWTIFRLDSGHSPFLSMPDTTASIVESAALRASD